MVELLSSITLWLGLFFLAIGSIGIIKMPDIYCKLHASGKCDTLGIFLAFAGISMQLDDWHQVLKIFLILVFIAIANPTSAHLVGRTAKHSNIKFWKKSK